MIFTDWKFFVFFAVAFSIYWAVLGNTARKSWLLACSVFFYAVWDWRFVGLVLLVIANTYVVTLSIAHQKEHGSTGRVVLATGISVSLGVLGFFKYYNFFIDTLGRLISLDATISAIILPIGISFYTFHSISYMVDTYRGKIDADAQLCRCCALHPLLSPARCRTDRARHGPASADDLGARLPSPADTKAFLLLFLIGYFKKAVDLRQRFALRRCVLRGPPEVRRGRCVNRDVGYAVQIYCDFSGYTDMAIAAAGLLGYQLRPNFAHPYLAASLIDFWRRWHISLSSWLRDYLYIPLGGNRCGHQTRNLLITMLLGGLWHGAAWTFVVWGALHGLGLVVNRMWRSMRRTPDDGLARYSLVGNLVTFGFVWLAWIFFRAPDLGTARTVLGRFAEIAPSTLLPWPYAVAALAGLGMAHVLFHRVNLKSLSQRIAAPVFACGYGGAVALVLPFVNIAARPFIYFQF